MRQIITEQQVNDAVEAARKKIFDRMKEKGTHTLASTHEILGIIDEEHIELNEAVRMGTHTSIRNELIDIAVAAIFGVACIDAKTLDW